MTHAVRGGRVVTADGIIAADVLIDGTSIAGVVAPGGGPTMTANRTIDAGGALVAPGLVDIQNNGAAGIDVSVAPDRLPELSEQLARCGVTSFLPTVITGLPDVRCRAVDMVSSTRSWPGAVPLGVHFEGPLISPLRRGAHPVEHVATFDELDISDWSAATGVRLVTLAPELDGAVAAIRELSRRGVVVALGHSDADRATVREAIDAGATVVTHLFNAMSPLGHREPGLAGTALTDERLRVGMIVDGVHVDPDIVRLAWKILGPERLVLVSDSVAATPVPGRRGPTDAARTEDGTLAGSLLTLDQAVRNLMRTTGCDAHEALICASRNPADVLGRRDLGRVEPGAHADLVILDDEDLDVRAVMVAGRPIRFAQG